MTYSSTLSISRGHHYGRNQNIIGFTTNDQRRLGPISNTIILVVLACLLGLLYLTQVTKTNAYGYQINGLQEKQASLLDEQNNLQLASARLQSLNRVQTSAAAQALVPVAPSGTVDN